MKYRNPIIRGFHPDPSICRVENDYFLVTSSFEYLPGVPIFHSKDLIKWEKIGHVLTRDSQIDLTGVPCSGGIFAPTIRYHDGVFYVITTNMNPEGKKSGNFIVHTTDPFKEWSDPIFIDRNGIDPSIYWENDRTYIQLSSFKDTGNEIEQLEIDLQTGDILTESKVISYGSGGRDAEAPHIYKVDGWYYLLLAEGGTREGHMVTILRSQSLWGPFEPNPNNPILSNRDFGREELQNVGHGDLIQDESGNWWIVALATRPIKHKHNLGRETILMPVEWDNGWPKVDGIKARSSVSTDRITASLSNAAPNVFIDDFTSKELSVEFNFIRGFLKNHYEMDGKLHLKGSLYSLNDKSMPSFIGKRQEEYECEIETKVEFSPGDENEEAGLAILMDNEHHVEFVKSIRNNKESLVLRKTVADMITEDVYELNEQQSLTLKICGDRKNYSFYVDDKEIGLTRIKHFSTEIATSMFTGVYIGMYASGNGNESKSTASFDYFKMENK